MKFLLCLSVCVWSVTALHAQRSASQWAPANTYPALPRATFYQAAAWLGDTLYVHTPTPDGLGSDTVYAWRYGSSQWTRSASLPAKRTGGAMVACSGRLFFIGGSDSVVTTNNQQTVFEYLPSRGSWLAKRNLPIGLTGHGAAAWNDSIIFVAGGPWSGSGANLNIYFYSVPADTWRVARTPLPLGQGRRSVAMGLAAGNQLLIAGGFSAAFFRTMSVGTIFQPDSIAWLPTPVQLPIPFNGLSRLGGVGIGNLFYILGGERGGGGGYFDSVLVYNARRGQWDSTFRTSGKPLKVANISNAVTARLINDTIRVFVAGGFGSASGAPPGTATAAFDVIDRGTSSLSLPPLPENTPRPAAFALEQNYPNPFNPSTEIRYQVSGTSEVQLEVFDVLGRNVATLVNERQAAGSYAVNFNAASLASGIYFYRLQSGSFVATRKMMLVK
jgi:hypothetical protein